MYSSSSCVVTSPISRVVINPSLKRLSRQLGLAPVTGSHRWRVNPWLPCFSWGHLPERLGVDDFVLGAHVRKKKKKKRFVGRFVCMRPLDTASTSPERFNTRWEAAARQADQRSTSLVSREKTLHHSCVWEPPTTDGRLLSLRASETFLKTKQQNNNTFYQAESVLSHGQT